MKKIDKRKLTKKFIYENVKRVNYKIPSIVPFEYFVTLNGVKIRVEFRHDEGYYCPVREIDSEDVNVIHLYFPWEELDLLYDHSPDKIIRF